MSHQVDELKKDVIYAQQSLNKLTWAVEDLVNSLEFEISNSARNVNPENNEQYIYTKHIIDLLKPIKKIIGVRNEK